MLRFADNDEKALEKYREEEAKKEKAQAVDKEAATLTADKLEKKK